MPSPLDFLHRNNNQDEWAKRYVGNKMGIQQMQEGGSPEDFLNNLINLEKESKSKQDSLSQVYSQPMLDRFSEEGMYNRKSLLEKLQMPEEAVIDTVYDMGSMGDKLRNLTITAPGRKATLQQQLYGGRTDKKHEWEQKKSELESLFRNKISESREDFRTQNPEDYNTLSTEILQNKYPDALKKVQEGYLNMDAIEQMRYDRKSKKSSTQKIKERQRQRELEERKIMNQIMLDKGYSQEDIDRLNSLRGYQHGGAVFESAPADETAHDQMNNLIFENEMKQSQGASPFSFLNRDRIDSQNQELMDAVMSMSVPAAGALSMGKSAFGKLADFPKSRVLSQIPVNKEIQKVNWNKMVRDRLPKSADKSLQNIKDLSWLEDLIKRNQ